MVYNSRHAIKTKCCWGTACYPQVKHSIVILDEKGVVRYVWVSTKSTEEPSYEVIQKTLEQIP